MTGNIHLNPQWSFIHSLGMRATATSMRVNCANIHFEVWPHFQLGRSQMLSILSTGCVCVHRAFSVSDRIYPLHNAEFDLPLRDNRQSQDTKQTDRSSTVTFSGFSSRGGKILMCSLRKKKMTENLIMMTIMLMFGILFTREHYFQWCFDYLFQQSKKNAWSSWSGLSFWMVLDGFLAFAYWSD